MDKKNGKHLQTLGYRFWFNSNNLKKNKIMMVYAFKMTPLFIVSISY